MLADSLECAEGGLGIAEPSLGDTDRDLGVPAGHLGDSFVPEIGGSSVSTHSGADCIDLHTYNAEMATCDTAGNAFNSLSGHLKAWLSNMHRGRLTAASIYLISELYLICACNVSNHSMTGILQAGAFATIVHALTPPVCGLSCLNKRHSKRHDDAFVSASIRCFPQHLYQ